MCHEYAQELHELGRWWLAGRRDPDPIHAAAARFRSVQLQRMSQLNDGWDIEAQVDRMLAKEGHQRIIRHLAASTAPQSVQEIANALGESTRWVAPKLSGAQRGRWLACDDGHEGYWMATALALDWVLRNPLP